MDVNYVNHRMSFCNNNYLFGRRSKLTLLVYRSSSLWTGCFMAFWSWGFMDSWEHGCCGKKATALRLVDPKLLIKLQIKLTITFYNKNLHKYITVWRLAMPQLSKKILISSKFLGWSNNDFLLWVHSWKRHLSNGRRFPLQICFSNGALALQLCQRIYKGL